MGRLICTSPSGIRVNQGDFQAIESSGNLGRREGCHLPETSRRSIHDQVPKHDSDHGMSPSLTVRQVSLSGKGIAGHLQASTSPSNGRMSALFAWATKTLRCRFVLLWNVMKTGILRWDNRRAHADVHRRSSRRRRPRKSEQSFMNKSQICYSFWDTVEYCAHRCVAFLLLTKPLWFLNLTFLSNESRF